MFTFENSKTVSFFFSIMKNIVAPSVIFRLSDQYLVFAVCLNLLQLAYNIL